MEKYKVLLVDDEEDVRRAIASKLDWAALGFAVVGEAANGEEALELAERLQPDVVMTDIKMPFMDGLTLCRRVKQLLPGVHLAVFSGFDEFEYAKEAISQQVSEYILKPIDVDELAAIFRRLKARLDEEIAQRRSLERLRQYYEESLPLMQQQIMTSLLEGGDQVADKLAQYDLDITAAKYCVAVVRGEYEGAERHSEEVALLTLSLPQLIGDTLAGIRYRLVRMPDCVALLFLLEEDGLPSQVIDTLTPLFALSRKLLALRLVIGVGEVRTRPDEICQSYREAVSALEYQILMEPDQCIYITDIEPGTAGSEEPDTAYIDEVIRLIKVGGEDELRTAVQNMVEHLRSIHTGIHQYQIYLLTTVTELLKLIRTYRLSPEEARQDALLAEGNAQRFSGLDEMGKWLFEHCDNLRRLARRERKDSARLLVERAKNIIGEHYADSDLSLDTVCNQLCVSSAYFSTLFKRETGQGFVGYLTALRMEKALELLTTTDERTYQIAERIGYTDPNYFSYVFKKHFGVSPSKYKAQQGDGS